MNSSSRHKALLLTIAALLLTNLVTLYFYSKQEPCDGKQMRQERKGRMREFLQNEVGFTEAQLNRFDSISDTQMKEIEPEMLAFRKSRRKIMSELGNKAFSDSAIIDAAGKLSGNQREMEIRMLRNMRDWRALCTEEQLPRFDTGFYKVMGRKKEQNK